MKKDYKEETMTLKGKTEEQTLRERLENSAKAQEKLRAQGNDVAADQFAEADKEFAERLARLEARKLPKFN
jgi:hypothetical protein